MRHRNILRKVSHAKFPLMAELDDTIRKNNLFFRQLLFLSVLILMGVVMLRELSFIIGSFLGAITLYIVFRPLQYRLIDRYRWRPWLASLLLVFLALLVLAGLLSAYSGSYPPKSSTSTSKACSPGSTTWWRR